VVIVRHVALGPFPEHGYHLAYVPGDLVIAAYVRVEHPGQDLRHQGGDTAEACADP